MICSNVQQSLIKKLRSLINCSYQIFSLYLYKFFTPFFTPFYTYFYTSIAVMLWLSAIFYSVKGKKTIFSFLSRIKFLKNTSVKCKILHFFYTWSLIKFNPFDDLLDEGILFQDHQPIVLIPFDWTLEFLPQELHILLDGAAMILHSSHVLDSVCDLINAVRLHLEHVNNTAHPSHFLSHSISFKISLEMIP